MVLALVVECPTESHACRCTSFASGNEMNVEADNPTGHSRHIAEEMDHHSLTAVGDL